jgi:hypothetical protein
MSDNERAMSRRFDADRCANGLSATRLLRDGPTAQIALWCARATDHDVATTGSVDAAARVKTRSMISELRRDVRAGALALEECHD